MSTQQVSRVNRFAIAEAPAEETPLTAGEYIMGVCSQKWRDPVSDPSPASSLFDDWDSKIPAALMSQTQLSARSSVRSLEELATHYLNDVGVLTKSADQVKAFLCASVESQFTETGPPDPGRGPAFLEAVIETRQKLCQDLMSAKLGGGASILTAELCARPLGQVFTICKEDVTGRATQMANGIAEQLLLGAVQGLFGICKWTSPSVMWYVRQECEIRFVEPTIERRGMTLTVTRHYEKWRAANEIHLMDAKALSGLSENLNWPKPIWNALGRMPGFLRPFVKTVIGTMFKKRIVAWKLGEGEHVTTAPASREMILKYPHKDPALCIGPVVLAGWDCHGINEAPKQEPGWFSRLMR